MWHMANMPNKFKPMLKFATFLPDIFAMKEPTCQRASWVYFRWLQSMSSPTNIASNTITVHPILSIHLSAFLSSPVWSKLAELSFKIHQHLTVFVTRRHLWFHFGLGVTALYCKYPKNGTDWLTNMGFLEIQIYCRHLMLTSQWDSKTSECEEAVPSANYD